MKSKVSKNNPDKRNNNQSVKIVLSEDCEKCINKCPKGISYLKRFAIKHEGYGVVCEK